MLPKTTFQKNQMTVKQERMILRLIRELKLKDYSILHISNGIAGMSRADASRDIEALLDIKKGRARCNLLISLSEATEEEQKERLFIALESHGMARADAEAHLRKLTEG